MQVIIRACDGENMLEKRMAVRGRHLENLSRIEEKSSARAAFWTRTGR